MKYILTLGLVALLLGCNTINTQTNLKQPSHDVSAQQTIHFVGPYDLTLQLTTQDNFQTATLVDNSDAQYRLKQVRAASGIRLEGENGVSIHFKATANGNEGYAELVKDKPIEIKEFKK